MAFDLVTMRQSRFLEHLALMKHGIIHLLGTGKNYKTGSYAQWCEFVPELRSRPKAFVGVPDISFLPAYLNARCVDSIYDVLPGELAIVDDVSRLYPSRGASDPDVTRFLGTISHKDILIFLTGQCSQNYDIAFHRDQEVLFCHKYQDIHTILAERPQVAIRSAMANREITRWSLILGAWRGFFSYVPEFQEVVYIPDPAPWYDERLSHSLRDLEFQPKVKKGVKT